MTVDFLFKFSKIIKGMFQESNRMDVIINVHYVLRIFWRVISPRVLVRLHEKKPQDSGFTLVAGSLYF